MGSYYYSTEPEIYTEFYSFDSLPWYNETFDDHWQEEQQELHLLTQYHYDESKYDTVAESPEVTEMYVHETAMEKPVSNFAVNQTNLPDSPVSFGDMFDAMDRVLTGPVAPPPKGSMRTYTYTLDNKKMLTVGDTGTAVNVIPKGTLEPAGFKITRPPDQKFLTTDGITISPLGICDEFNFKLGGIQFTIKIYVCKCAGFQLLLGTHFWWSMGAALFPRLGKIILTRPALRIISATCDILPPEKRPPPLAMQQLGKPPEAKPMDQVTVDPISGMELLEQPPPEFHYIDVRPLCDEDYTPFLKITTHKDVITVGERDYIREIDEDEEHKEEKKSEDVLPPDIITDTFVRDRLDINPAAPNWFKERIIAMGMKYHKAVSWTENDLGMVTDVPHEIVLKEGTVPVRQATRRYLYLPKNEEIIRKKAFSLIRLGIWRKCHFSPWLTQLVLSKKGRVCHDFTSLNAATVLDAFPIHSMLDIVAAQAGKGIWSIMDTDRGYMQIVMALLFIFLTAFEMFH